MKIFTGIRSKIFLVVFMVLGPALCLNLYFAIALRDSARNEAKEQALRYARATNEYNNNEIESIKQFLLAISKTSNVHNESRGKCSKLFKDILNNVDNKYIDLMLIDRMGDVVCQASKVAYNANYHYHSLVGKVNQLKDLVVRKFSLNSAKSKIGVIFAYPIIKNGEVIATLAAVADDRWLERLEHDNLLPAESVMTMLDEYGLPIYEFDSSSINKRLFLPTQEALAPILNQGYSIIEGTGRDGIDRIYAIFPVSKANHSLFWCAALPAKTLFSNAENLFWRTLIILSIAAIMLFVVVWVVSNRIIIEPINHLVDATKSLSLGNHKMRINDISKTKELNQLALAFDFMAKAIVQREKELEQARKKYENILNTTHDPILALNESFHIQFYNDSAKKAFVIDKSFIASKKIFDLFTEDSRPRLLQQFNIFANATDFTLYIEKDLKCTSQDGREFPVEISVSKLKIQNKMVYTVIIRDITERVTSAAAKAMWNNELERSNTELEYFAYNLSNDLQEPLRMISAHLRSLQNTSIKQLDAKQKDYLSFAADGVSRLQNMLKDLLSYSTTKNNKRRSNIDCNKLVSTLLQDISGIVISSGAKIYVENLPTIYGNETSFRQVFQTLIINAINFRSTCSPIIKIQAESNNYEWIFSVEDNGIGMDPNFASNIFSLSRNSAGIKTHNRIGVGLALSRRIIENAGGRIWVKSIIGQGSKFYFTIKKHLKIHGHS